jgi:hypothetical protein
MAGFCELVIGLRAPKLAVAGAKSPIVSGGYLKYSHFRETATGDRVQSGLRDGPGSAKAWFLTPEAFRLQEIWSGESRRLHQAALLGECKLTSKEQWAVVSAMPEAKEHTRVAELMRPHYEARDELIDQMWAMPAQTPEGKAAKLIVLLSSIMGDDWREHDGAADVDVRFARALMIELVGGEPAAQLHDRFAG